MSSQSGQLQLIDINTEACNHWLRFQAKALLSASKGSIFIRGVPPQSSEIQTYAFHWPANLDNTSNFHQVISRAEQEQKGVILSFQQQDSKKDHPANTVHIAFPLALEEHSTLTAAFELHPKNTQQLQKSMHQLEWGLHWFKEEHLTRPDNCANEANSSAVKKLLQSIDQQSNLMNAARILVNELANHFKCHRVSLGQYQKDHISVLAISHQTIIDHTSRFVRDVAKTMEECSDQDTTITFPAEDERPGPITHQHQKFSTSHGTGNILSLPLSRNNRYERFILLLEKDDPGGFLPFEKSILDDLSNTLGPILSNISLNERSISALAVRRIKNKLENLSQNKPSSLIKSLVPLLLLLIVFFGKGDLRIKTDVTLTGTILRSIVSPFPGYVAKASKGAGDHAEKGEVLAQLDTSDITLDELSWNSKYTQADLEYRKAIADNATSRAKIIGQQKKQAEIQLSLLKMQEERAEIKAPFSGLIVKGDLSQSIGSPVEKGKLLFEMVPDGGYKIHALVDETDIIFIEEGQSGTLVFNSLPKDSYQFTVSKITPIATAYDGTNAFRVEANLTQGSKRLTPGMTGYGKITVGRKPYIWLWTRTFRNRLRLLSWDLMP